MVIVIIAETGRLPVDNPATHLELTMVHEAMVLEYAGPRILDRLDHDLPRELWVVLHDCFDKCRSPILARPRRAVHAFADVVDALHLFEDGGDIPCQSWIS